MGVARQPNRAPSFVKTFAVKPRRTAIPGGKKEDAPGRDNADIMPYPCITRTASASLHEMSLGRAGSGRRHLIAGELSVVSQASGKRGSGRGKAHANWVNVNAKPTTALAGSQVAASMTPAITTARYEGARGAVDHRRDAAIETR
ncbi:hypothetical protein PSPO01_09687 [Paraphaeosphaeria sporulosa]